MRSVQIPVLRLFDIELYYHIYMKRISISFCLLLAIFWLSAQEHKLWYDHPAQSMDRGFAFGKQAFTVMVFGNPAVEQVQLDKEETLGRSS